MSNPVELATNEQVKRAPNAGRRPDPRWVKAAEWMASNATVSVTVVEVATNRDGRPCGLNTILEGLRAFLPGSQTPRGVVYQKGMTIEVKVIECDANDRGGKLVVSRTAAMQDERQSFLSSLSEGQEVTGPVVSVVDNLGYFVNIGSMDALLHITQTPLEGGSPKVFQVGDTVTARISSINSDTGRVSLSMRAPRPEGRVSGSGDRGNDSGGHFNRGKTPAPRSETFERKPAPTQAAVVSAPKLVTPIAKPVRRKAIHSAPTKTKTVKPTKTFGSFGELAAHFNVGVEQPATTVESNASSN